MKVIQNNLEYIENIIKEVVVNLLKERSDSLDLYKSFFDLGVNSVLAVELIEAINQQLGIELEIQVIFDYRGIKELAKYIFNQYGKNTREKKGINNNHQAPRELASEVAIIGISGKFAGSETIEEFWDHLQAGDSCIEEINRKGWEQNIYYHPDPLQMNKSISKWGGFLKNIDDFDALFFNIPESEVEKMDPQQYLFLEEAYKAFEDGGYSTEYLSGKKVGVFIGGRNSGNKGKKLLDQEINAQTFLANDMSVLAARISYFLNLKGPSIAIDTACSSSLVAIHLACNSIYKGESEIALAGGVFILNSPEFLIMSSKTGMLSPDGKCRTFSKKANGMVIGEGVGALVLKRLDAAMRDRDHIYGVIKCSAINQDGKTNGITAPSMLSQKALIYETYKNSSIHPETVSYVEAHGTGTKLGDLIEIKALTEAFREFTDESQFCVIGSHKPNIGHTVMTSGIAGVFKILMAMKYRKIPANIGVTEENEQIDFKKSPFFTNTSLREWKSKDEVPLRAGISAFGFSGTNCHIIFEEPPQQNNSSNNPVRPYYIFPFSAKTKAALVQKFSDMANWLEKEGENHSIEDISYSLSIGRCHFPVRYAFIAKDMDELKHKIMKINESGAAEKFDGDSYNKDPILEGYDKQLIEELQGDCDLISEEYKERLIVLSELYAKGYNLNWESLFKAGKYYRIPLPTYPFNGGSCWISETGDTELQETVEINLENILANKNIQSYISEAESEGGMRIKELDSLLCKLLWGQLQSLGFFIKENTLIADLKAKTGLRNLYHRWLEESIAVLARHNYLKYDGASCTVHDTMPLNINAVWKEWGHKKVTWMENPNLKAQVTLVEAMLRALPEILTGKVLATDIMFPGSTMELVEGIYKNNLVADYFNEVLADTLIVYIQERLKQGSSARIRILEIGAGTGGTSAVVFQKIKPFRDHIQEYCYTDISKAFLMYAEEKYGPQNPYLTYQIFNVEKPVAGQGAPMGGYDIVIAANVLHATRNIRQTLGNVKAALKKNGLIILNEINSNSLFNHLTFGLLEGWWLYEDPVLRIPGCPGLYPETWRKVLENEGFRSVFFPAQEAHDLGQQIIAAKSNGVIVRQKQQIKSSIKSVDKRINVIASRSYLSNKTPQLFIAKDQHPILLKTNAVQRGVDITDQLIEENIKEIILEKLSESLKVDIDMIDVDEPFRDYGVDSISGVRLVQVINQILMIGLETTSLFDYSSVNKLTNYILLKYKDEIIKTLGQGIEQASANDGLSRDDKKNRPAYSYPKRILRLLPEPDIIKKEEHSRDLIQKDLIAIIGISGRFIRSKNVHELWGHLSNGTNLIEEVKRWDLSKYYSKDMQYCKFGSLLEDIDKFDPLFFNISGLEAAYMDPQQRIFLEESWKALEDAGYAGAGVQGCLCGVYVGCMGGDYQQLLAGSPPAQAFWGNMGSVVPARIAYYLDLQGPAITVDTACSSSLVAIHLACQGLWANEIEMALAGGVFIQSTPEFYLHANRAGMLSSTGRCYTFDERADGFVPGEGVGVVVLKRLKEAIKDGDHIYGVIRGSGINQDGTTNGITAPSAKSQERLECQVYDTFKIHPEHIQLVEAHGTGTKLGDPIEFQALTRAFRKYTDKKEYCAVGSIKTNLGHTQIAAGVAGVIKVVMSLQHKKIPPSLHFQSGNKNIEFKDSPFYVNTGLKDWDIGPDSKRCAVVSSFGASGTNAHMVIEEAPKVERQYSEKPGYLIVLSARTFEQLRQQAGQMIDFCQQKPQVNCGNMSYTLFVGRKHFNHRLACVVKNQHELVKLLKRWLEKGKVSQIYVSKLGEHDHREQPSLKRYGNQCIRNCQSAHNADYLEQLSTVADFYVQGYGLEYEQLFLNDNYSRIPLPTYPFARERYWIPEINTKSAGISLSATLPMAAPSHPLLHQNTSDLFEQRFSSIFTGQEFFLEDHIVKGRRVLPGVAYLEMARAAVEQAAPVLEENRAGIRLKNVVWAHPIAIGEQPVQVHIGLFSENNGEIIYEIYSEPEESHLDPVVHSQGTAMLSSAAEALLLDLTALQLQCSQSILSSAQCYETFRYMGLDYGPGHQGIEKIYLGPGQLLAKLSLPASVYDTLDQFVLHPSMTDSALQASVCLMMAFGDADGRAARRPPLPFTLQELEIRGSCTPDMWAFIRYSDGSKAGDKVQKIDIDLCDDQGHVCVQMKGFSARVLEGEAGSAGAAATLGTLLLHPCWKEQAVNKEATDPVYAQHLVLLCEPDEVTRESIETQMNGVRCLPLELFQQNGIEERFQAYAARAFEEIQNILKNKPQGKVLIQVIVSTREEQQLLSGLSGLLRTARLENPKLIGQLIEVEPGENSTGIVEKLKENSRSPVDNQIRYQAGKRLLAGWSEMEISREASRIPWKDRGIYLITGGAGGLGLIFAEEIAHKVIDAVLILAGRSPLSNDKRTRIERLQALGARIEYKQFDVTQRKAVTDLIQSIQEDFGNLNGIIHGAGVIRDSFIIKKTRDELREVLAPKVAGLVNLDQATKELPLDFFVLFSSISGSLGNPGQADYSTANVFMDAYARYRNSLVLSKQRHGQTLSINWPLWREGGMRVDEETEKMMTQSMGMMAMQTATGIKALYQGLASGKDQVMVLEGKVDRMKQKLLSISTPGNAQPEKNTAASASTRIAAGGLLDKVQAALMQIVSKLLKVKMDVLDTDTELNEYGFDSITLTQFTNKLNEAYNLELNPTIFFEHPTLQSFAEYLMEEHQAVFAAKYGAQTRAEHIVQTIDNSVEESPPGKRRRSRFTKITAVPASKQDTNVPEPIAIVGMSGIFPMARDVNEFWDNLAESKDCITEIPESRWNWQQYYGDPAKEANKTNIKWGGFIDGVDEFDPLFFGISPLEAELMDPQQRLLMTYVWKAIEDAGYSAQSLSGTKTAIFVGTASSGYSGLISQTNRAIEAYSSTGMVPSVGPNRMSYFLNIHGPSEPIETACSSSLVALHRAVCAMENGSCEMAIAGGVNTIVTPELHISFNKAGMLCEDGRCKTFSNKANGYARGEGVGMLFLKKLKAAEQSGDHIYGLIQGTAENHGGRGNSLTAPNPKAQAELLQTAYTKAGIDPRTVTYIEAHGTGTELGDPIEINGLKAAFKELYQATGEPQVTAAHCGLGSVKTNIGHLELAAGIAGVIKVLLQLKHKTLVKSLHCDIINPYIQLNNSPFYLVQETKEWKPLKDSKGKDLPRRAGVSSFGFGGANAHVVIEEYIPKDPDRPEIAINPQNPAIIVLSARNEERLKEQAQQLLAFIGERQFIDADLAHMAYTLQIGREAMEERLGMIAVSMKELEEKLKSFVEGRDDIEAFFQGQVQRHKETLAAFTADEDMQKVIDAWIRKGKHAKILDLWVKGFNIDWDKLYVDTKPHRISLPTYPFARERYWVPETATNIGNTTTNLGISASLHPLLHQNTSDLSEQRFSTTFTGKEFFLADHVVGGQRVFPGAAHLEMARAAVEQSAGDLKQGQTGIRLKNFVWSRPIVVMERPVQVHIALFSEDSGQIACEIYGKSGETGAGPVVYSQGSAELYSLAGAPVLDLKILREQCSNSSLISSQCYDTFRSMGLQYGPGHQGIEKIYMGREQVLAKLSLPSSVSENQDNFVLHPGMVDSALQASIYLMMDTSGKALLKPALPFALQELEILHKCTPGMWALIRYGDSGDAGEKMRKIDIDMCDEQGRVCIRIKGFTARVPEGEIPASDMSSTVPEETAVEPLVGTTMLIPVWDSISVGKVQTFPFYTDQVVIVGGDEDNRIAIQKHFPEARVLEIGIGNTIEEIVQNLKGHGPIDHVLWIAPHNPLDPLTGDALIEGQKQGVLLVFKMIKALLGLGYGAKNLGWTVITMQTQPIHKKDSVNPTHASLYGLLGSMSKEYPNWKVRLVDLEADCDWPIDDIFTLPPEPQGNALVYRGQEWHRQRLIPFQCSPAAGKLCRTGGVYVVIGGAGGIGEVWSEYMIRTYQARIIWIGRRQKNAAIQAKLDRLAGLGPAPHYIAADATDGKALYQAYEEIKKRYWQIHGVIHSAIVLLDKSLVNMEEEQFKAGLSTKVDVSARMAQVFYKEPLDFIIFFSSMIAFTKAPGQSNYASGCTFKDAFALQLAHQWPCAVKVINWGYWGSVGIVASKVYQDRLAQIGMGSIEPPEAMEALEVLLTGPADQIVFMKTTKHPVMPEMNPEELITVYPENLPSNIQNVLKHIPKKYSHLGRIKSEMDRQMKDMDGLLCKLLWGQLQSVGLFMEENPVIAELKTKIGLSDLYYRWFEESMGILARNNYLRFDGKSCRVMDSTPVNTAAVWEEWDRTKSAWLENPDRKARVVLVEAMLRALPKIITGKIVATDIMFPNSSMELIEGIYKNNKVTDYYNEVLANTIVVYIQERLRQDSSAQIRIIEIGAGTGGTSAMVFRKLKPYLEHIQEYCYTDISKAFLLYAEKEYGPENSYLTYKIFNVEQPVVGQGIPAGEYDIAIAANVLHATKNIRQAIRNAKAVLKKNGLFLLNEISGKSLFTHLTFGLLEGWWLYEDTGLRIPGCPALYPAAWQEVLESEGFRSILYPAQEAHDWGQQIVAAESDGMVRQKRPCQPGVIPGKKSGAPISRKTPAQDIHSQLQKTEPIYRGPEVIDQMVKEHVRTIIRKSIAETLKLKERQIQDDRFFSEYGVDSIIAVNLVNLISRQCKITLQTTALFDYNNVNQLLRHIIREHKSALITSIQENMPLKSTAMESRGEAIAVAQGQLFTYHNVKRKGSKYKSQLESVKSPKDFLKEDNQQGYYRMVIERPGGIEDLKVIKSAVPELKENEIRIAVRAFSLNFGDLLCVKGLYPTMPPYPFTPGFEASGIVVDIGESVTSVRPGDAVVVVMGETLGAQASMITCSARQAFLKPETLSFEEACALPVVAMTMINAFRKARLKRGERILIQTATGGTGLIAVQLAKYYGAEIYATAGSQHKLDYLEKLGVSYRINYQETDFEKELSQLTHGKGVDVVINTLPGDAIQKGLNCLSPGGRYIEIAMTALKSARTIDLSVLNNNQTFYSIDLRKLGLEDPETFKLYQKEMIQLLAQKIIHPTICKVFSWDRIKEAYGYMESRGNIGKIVVRIPAEYRYRNTVPVENVLEEEGRFMLPALQKDSIAIIGMSGKFPMAKDINQFWANIVEGKDCITEIPEERWDWKANCSDPTKEASNTSIKWGGFIDGVDQFDPLFFRISPKEAELMDPQQRLLMTYVWRAIEDAGINPKALSNSPTGVFIATGPSEYINIGSISRNNGLILTGNYQSIIPNRISYELNLHGPSEYCDTACSSALVALHRAIQSINNHECEQAIVGAVNLLLSPAGFIGLDAMGYLSPEGQSRPFQAKADGFVRSEGVGVIILKPLPKAIEDQDLIYAVIKGTGVSHGGKGLSLTAPLATGMKAAMLQAYQASKIDPRTVSYIEAHGSATPLGDGIEINALKSGYQELAKVYSQKSQTEPPCYISSLKPCIGHGERFSGMAALIKVISAIRHKLIPGVPQFSTLNENISLEGSPFQITAENHNWEALTDTNGNSLPRRASINSYGLGGVNAHVVIEEYIPSQEETFPTDSTNFPQIVVFSAKNPGRLQAVVQQVLEFIELQKNLSLPNLAYTLQVGREAMESRMAMVVSNREQLVQGMKEYLQSIKEGGEIDTAVPIFAGDLEDEHSELASLLDGKAGETVLQAFWEERNLEKLALHWTKGCQIPWESLHEGKGARRMSLPAYPFEKRLYWLSQAGEQHPAKTEENRYSADQVTPRLVPNNLNTLIKKRLSELLGIPVGELPTRKSLDSLGFNSLQAITFRAMLERDIGFEIPLALVMENRTVQHLESNLNEIIKLKYTEHQVEANIQNNDEKSNTKQNIQLDTSEILPEIIPNLADRFQSFPLNDIQESFLAGRKLRFGGDWVGCHIYFEIEVKDIDIYRLNKAWESLIKYHEMLRSVVLSNGQQKILEKTPPYKFKIVDLRRKDHNERSRHLENVRKKMSHKVYEPGQWPFFEIRISVYPDSKYIIHFSIDELIIDASGVYMLLQQWQLLYKKPEWKFPELSVSFRDYILAIKKFENSNRYNRDLEYWMEKLKNMPGGPVLPLQQKPGKPDSKDDYCRVRLNGTLEEKQWQFLKKKAKELNVSTTALLLSIFTEVLSSRSKNEKFSLLLTFFNRLPLHSQLEQILGPFISTSIFVVEEKKGRSFEKLIKDNQECLWGDLDHSSVSGIRALRELKARRKISGSLHLPVVFTSLVNNFKSDHNEESFFKQISFMVTQTPQVYLDHQVFEQDGRLKFSWDVAEGYFGAGEIRNMFSDYCRFLNMLASEDGRWQPEALTPDMKGENLFSKEENKTKAAAAMCPVLDVLPAGLKLEVLTADSFMPFPLTDQQQAYAFGRYMSGGNNSCQLYLEIEATELDPGRLEKAWKKLMKTHQMLITVIRPDGTQRIVEEVPDFKIKVMDLTGKKAEEVQAKLSATKRFMLEHVFNLEEWPYFDLRVSVMDSTKSRIHFTIDLIIADANSIHLLMKQLFYYYENPTKDPKKVDVLFRDYVMALQKYKKAEGYQRSIQYWENKFAGIPPGPQLPMKSNGKNGTSFEYRQFKGVLLNWEALKKTAHRLSVSPSMILLTAYTEVLGAWMEQKPFTIVVPCWERLPLHPEIDEVIGDFTAMSWVVTSGERKPFEKKVKLNHSIVREDLSHMAVSGLKVLRKAAMKGRHKGMLTFPVVFTNMMPHFSVETAKGFKKIEMLSKTPQVYLDNISEERDGRLYFYWDVIKEVYPEGLMEEMFAGYKRLLEALSGDSMRWAELDPGEIINAQPEKYKNLMMLRGGLHEHGR
ncbi:malonyl CoA-acyl carrier protein transacylase [Desulfocucumis palustris]|uniref:Malonyl CoA-acyl carrier protein transacylase n=1 Tax=Desulfocucumis palustris TaxID=1898651 RepID=A0A2L2X9R7_9FIRM|nr:SDR family NAD(P)-dependent oxidoreductase [Desulfocucumis palustris]GBF33017.1 malonyl CoA-acyl carrier protein transacylase [Desulfocucumis palustris]